MTSMPTSHQPSPKDGAENARDRLLVRINELIAPLGYEVVYLEVQMHRDRVLRLFIDFKQPRDGNAPAIGIQDCVSVTKLLDEPLETADEITAIFHSAPYELEVSSPGADRPLRGAQDFARFHLREARVQVFRPLSAEELGNAGYHAKNPRQKSFLGTIQGLRGESVLLSLTETGSAHGKPGKKGKKAAKASDPATNSAEAAERDAKLVSIPLPLISKANLEPRFDFGCKPDGFDDREPDVAPIDLGEESESEKPRS